MTCWAEYTLNEKTWRRWDVGPLAIWGRCVGDEFHLASDAADEDAPEPPLQSDTPAEDAEIRRWVLRREALTLALTPVLPDRPVVVRPEAPLRFPTGRRARIYVSLPVWVRLTAKQPDEQKLTEIPSVTLSNSWFGDPTDGMLAYSLKTRARRDLANIVARPHRALCPITIENQGDEELDMQRFCLHTAHLAIYGAGEDLWTSEVHVRFGHRKDASELEFGNGAPPEAKEATLLTDAREPVTQNVFLRGMQGLARLTGLVEGK